MHFSINCLQYFFHDTYLDRHLVNVVKEAGCVAEYVDIIDML